MHGNIKRNENKKPTLKERGFYDKNAWKKARMMALQRDRHLCQGCLRRGRITVATTVHHVKPTASYPELALELGNMESLCRDCHDAVHQRRGETERKYPVRVIKA